MKHPSWIGCVQPSWILFNLPQRWPDVRHTTEGLLLGEASHKHRFKSDSTPQTRRLWCNVLTTVPLECLIMPYMGFEELGGIPPGDIEQMPSQCYPLCVCALRSQLIINEWANCIRCVKMNYLHRQTLNVKASAIELLQQSI